jgi:hypothetical protein
MAVFIFLVIAVVVIIVVVRQNKRGKAVEELKHNDSHTIAVEIKDELSRKGYEVGELLTDFDDGEVYGFFGISSKEKGTKEGGTIYFSMRSRGLKSIRSRLQFVNASERSSYRYAIDNANINLLVCSDEKSLTPPLFLEIAAEVLKRGDFVFNHPDYIDEYNARDYLNVGLVEG